jgi:hypothetical protein
MLEIGDFQPQSIDSHLSHMIVKFSILKHILNYT